MNPANLSEEKSLQDVARIEGLSVPYIIRSVCKSGSTGVLHFLKGKVKKSLYIREGSIIFATSSERDDRLGEILIKNGKVTYKDLEKAIARLGKGKRLGAILQDSSAVRPEDLVQAVIEQMKMIIYSIFSWKNGGYKFVEGDLPTNEIITLNLSTSDIIFQGVKEIEDFKILLKSLGSLKKRFVLGPNYEKNMVALLEEEERKIIDFLRGPSSAEEIQEETGLDMMTVVRTLVAFKITGIIEDEPSPVARAFLKGSDLKGDLKNDDIIDTIGQIAERELKGVLYVNAESLQAGLRIAARKINALFIPDEKRSFLSFLILNGGVERFKYLSMIVQTSEDELDYMSAIEEELGEAELQKYEDMFAAQILSDIVRLKEGEFIFIEREELPTPSISLEIPLERMIMEQIAHVDNWERVRKGCGELDTTLRITERYLDIMDTIPVSKDLWDVVSRLQNPMTVMEVLSLIDMKEFEMCRLLWALQATGIIKRIEARDEISIPVTTVDEVLPEKEEQEERAERAAVEHVSEASEEIEEKSSYNFDEEKHQEEVIAEDEEEREEEVDEAAEEEVEEEVQIDEEIVKEIEKFNEKQKYVFEKVKMELGAGARNFIHYCKGRLGQDSNNPFIELIIDVTGEWVPKDLGKKIMLNQLEDHRSIFDKFIAVQLEMVGELFSKAKEEELKKGIREIEKRQVEID